MISKVEDVMKTKGITVRKLRELTAKSDDPDHPDALSMSTIIKARGSESIGGCSLSTLERIAKALGCSIHDLFDDGES